jgi:lysophospholipase L1-like esterase
MAANLGLGLGLGQYRSFGGAVAPVIPLRTVTVNNRIAASTSTTGFTNCVLRWPFYMGQDATDIVVNFLNWTQSTSGQANTGNDYTVVSCAIENDGGTISTPVTWSGGRSKTLADGDNDVNSDVVYPTAFSTSTFTRGTRYWVKFIVSVPTTAGKVPVSDQKFRTTVTNSQVGWYNPAVTTPSSTDTPGLYTATGTAFSNQTLGICPIILGHPVSDGFSMIALGDSIISGSGDTSVTNQQYGQGNFQRALRTTGGADLLSGINFARTGCSATSYTGTNTKWQAYAKYARFMHEGLGTNDIGTGTSSVVATIQTNLSSIWTAAKAQGVEKIVRNYLLQRTTSTDSWATTANQTIVGDWASGGKTDTLNAWFETQKTAGNITDTFAHTYTADSVATDKWAVNGSAGYGTTDGLHPTSTLHQLMADAMRTVYLTL